MEIILAKTAGFCFGVKRAVDTVYNEITQDSDVEVFTYGPIIHNEEVVDDLNKKGVKVSGATTHFVSEEVDGGPIILQKAIDISSCNSAEEIQQLILTNIEHKLLVETVSLYCDNKLKIENERVIII